MAAKVVMVAVPTVVGLASLRVYSVTEPPADGLGCRELPIYTPVPPSPQYRFAEAKPGVLESGLTSARESLLPAVHSAQTFCVSVKNGSVRAYQSAGDVYHYLRDPPPGFLPRLGTITTAGMLGMILARKGSRFRRVAVPLGLMSAGASVCYPAQTVAVVKVSSRKLLAAGQWTTATVSSAFASKPKEVVAETVTSSAPPPQSDAGPKLGAPVAEDPPAHDTTSTSSDPDVTSAEPLPQPPSPVAEEAPQEPTADAGAESVQVETSPVPEEPIVLEQQAPPEEPAAVAEEPAVLKEPALIDEPIAVDEPAVLQEPAVREEPAVLQEPAVVEEPIAVEEPAVVQEAAVIAEAAVVEEPTLEEPAVPKEPAVVEEPIVLEEPIVPEAVTDTAETPGAPAGPETSVAPPTEQTPAAPTTGGSGFQPNPALMDFGQSSPEDEDLYSTRT